MMSPGPLRDDELGSADRFGRSPRVADMMQSPDFRSIGRRAEWGAIDLPSIPSEVKQKYADIQTSLENLMAGLQGCLREAGFDWLHPSDLEIIANSAERRLFVRFLAGYQGSEFDFPQQLCLTAVCIVGDHESFEEFRPELKGWLEKMVGGPVSEPTDDT
jgi:hypothetical protein